LLVASADDFHLMDVVGSLAPNLMLIARSRGLPALESHLRQGGTAIWHEKHHSHEAPDQSGVQREITHDVIHLGDGTTTLELMPSREIPASMGSRVLFQLANAMTAAAIAYATGINLETIQTALSTFEAQPEMLPASFNIHRAKSFSAYVNRLETPGITRSILRAINPRAKRRQITVVGDLAERSPAESLEIGRMLGRNHGAILLHSQSDEHLVEQMRRGIAADAYPPLVIHFDTERRALNRAFQSLQEGDTLLVLASDDGRAANRAIARQIANPSATPEEEPA
jgi:UDP-N-acetylmuramyl tripeptide synthase